jgi:glutathione-regulated potassium-efflux system ancillary protein KefF
MLPRVSRVLVVYAHPYPDRSRCNRHLVAAVRGVEGVTVRSLYALYPDFAIDAEAEQSALTAASAVVWQHPLYWYTAPALLKLWFEKVLARGWAYGSGRALAGKRCLWVTTTGADADSYTPEGVHGHALEAFLPVVQQTARFCGMSWEPPLVVHHAHHLSPEALDAAAADYRARVEALGQSSG